MKFAAPGRTTLGACICVMATRLFAVMVFPVVTEAKLATLAAVR